MAEAKSTPKDLPSSLVKETKLRCCDLLYGYLTEQLLDAILSVDTIEDDAKLAAFCTTLPDFESVEHFKSWIVDYANARKQPMAEDLMFWVNGLLDEEIQEKLFAEVQNLQKGLKK